MDSRMLTDRKPGASEPDKPHTANISDNNMSVKPLSGNPEQERAGLRFSDTKPHYELLDGLRGIAALLVIIHHVGEGFAFAESVNGAGDGIIRWLNHGYLAVDFFFLLSGFVIGYAYDDRWQNGFTLKDFFKRRLIRLHPMVILAAVIGLITFLIQGSANWDGTPVPVSLAMLALLAAMFMIPARPGSPYEVRGNGEMFPLNGPAWSLFFEYIGNILYALFIRRFSTKVLAVLTVLLGGVLAWMTVGDLTGADMFGIGWTLDNANFAGGLVRMLFPYTLGMLMSRCVKPGQVRGAFGTVAVALTLLFAVPYIPSEGAVSLNGLFEAVTIIAIFPVLLWLGASGKTEGKRGAALCRFLGDISYPLYIVHYPLFYLFYHWLIKNEIYSPWDCVPAILAVVAGSVLLAWASLRFYDIPLRKFLIRKYVKSAKKV